MTSNMLKLRFGTATFAIAAGLSLYPTAAAAQTAAPPAASTAPPDQGGSTIVVTGSRIRRAPLDQAQPVTFVDRADLDRTGLTSTAEVLQRLPGSGGALNSRFN